MDDDREEREEWERQHAPVFEVYWYDERIGSEHIEVFRTQEAADKFGRSLPGHMMAHW